MSHEIFDNSFVNKYQTMDPTERAGIAKYANIANLFNDPLTILAFDDIRMDLLRTIPETDAKATGDRESIFYLHKGVDLLQQYLQHNINEYHAMIASDAVIDRKADSRIPEPE